MTTEEKALKKITGYSDNLLIAFKELLDLTIQEK